MIVCLSTAESSFQIAEPCSGNSTFDYQLLFNRNKVGARLQEQRMSFIRLVSSVSTLPNITTPKESLSSDVIALLRCRQQCSQEGNNRFRFHPKGLISG